MTILEYIFLGNVQQIAELSSETHSAVASMVAMAPGTVTVVQQVNIITALYLKLIGSLNLH